MHSKLGNFWGFLPDLTDVGMEGSGPAVGLVILKIRPWICLEPVILYLKIPHPRREMQGVLKGPWTAPSTHPCPPAFLLALRGESRKCLQPQNDESQLGLQSCSAGAPLTEEESWAPESSFSEPGATVTSIQPETWETPLGRKPSLRGDRILLPVGLPFPLDHTQTREHCTHVPRAGNKQGYFLWVLNTGWHLLNKSYWCYRGF